MTVRALEQYEKLERVEFDSPFLVGRSGTLHTESIADTFAPSVYHDDDTDIVIDSDKWEAFSVGYTGQYSYNGAVMHASETLSGRLADDILTTPGVYVVVAVEVLPEGDDTEPEPAGWAVLNLKEV